MNEMRRIRKDRGMTLCAVASKAGISIQFLADLERDRRSAKPETMQRIADVLGVKVEEMKDKQEKAG